MKDKIAEIIMKYVDSWDCTYEPINSKILADQILALISQEHNKEISLTEDLSADMAEMATKYYDCFKKLKKYEELLKGVGVEEECQYNDHMLCGANEKGIGDCYHPDTPTCHGEGTITRQATIEDVEVCWIPEHYVFILESKKGRLVVKE